jgi:hypothetical protein
MAIVVPGNARTIAAGSRAPLTARVVVHEIQDAARSTAGAKLVATRAGEEFDGVGSV